MGQAGKPVGGGGGGDPRIAVRRSVTAGESGSDPCRVRGAAPCALGSRPSCCPSGSPGPWGREARSPAGEAGASLGPGVLPPALQRRSAGRGVPQPPRVRPAPPPDGGRGQRARLTSPPVWDYKVGVRTGTGRHKSMVLRGKAFTTKLSSWWACESLSINPKYIQ